MPTLRLIGDVHGRFGSYLDLTNRADHSLQVGDLGLSYFALRTGFDATRHRAIAGNHDNYGAESRDYFKGQPVFLGDYGLHEVPGLRSGPIFYTRGGWSIDHEWRKQKQDDPNYHGPRLWWPEEQLSDEELEKAIALYAEARPEIVVTHEAPLRIVQFVTNPHFVKQFGYDSGVILTRTNAALDRMLDIHQPKLWVFGHYHQRWEAWVKDTKFVCLDMLREGGDNRFAYLDLPLEG